MRRHGFEVFRAAADPCACARVREIALRLAATRPWRARLLTALGLDGAGVRAPRHRAHVALPLDDDVAAILTAAATRADAAFEAAGLGDDANLVELSAMVAFPGAEAQAPHSDVPPDAASPVCTLWVRAGVEISTSRRNEPVFG